MKANGRQSRLVGTLVKSDKPTVKHAATTSNNSVIRDGAAHHCAIAAHANRLSMVAAPTRVATSTSA